MKDWKTELNNLLKEALKKRDSVKSSVLKMLKADLTNEEIKNNREELTEDQIDTVIRRAVRKRREAIEEFKKVERLERAEEEEKELKLLMEFLPEQLDEKELGNIIDETIKEINAESIKDIGKTMGIVMSKVKGKADGKMVQELVRKKLA